MARPVSPVVIDTHAEIKRMLLEKKTVREIAKLLACSTKTVMGVRKRLLGEPVIKKSRATDVGKTNNGHKNTKEHNAENPDETTIEGTRKRVELKALEVLEARLDDPDCDAKTATAALNVVGTKPKAESGDLTVIIQSINNFGSEARKRMIERMAAEKQVIDVSPEVLSDTNEPAAAVPENPDKGYDATQ